MSTKYRNCVLIVIDCLRADILNSYGGELEFFSGKTWLKAFAGCGWTLPSHASIFSGVPCPETTLVNHRQVLSPDVETIAEAFQDMDFHTFASVNNSNLSERFGLNRGFDEYILHLNGPDDLDYDRPFENFRGLLNKEKDKPYFGVLHTNIVHDYFIDSPWAMEGVRVSTHNKKRPLHLLAPALHGELRQRYYNCIEEVVCRLKSQILSIVNLNDTMVVITSDHGEGLWTPRLHHGGRLHNDLLHVPLVVLNETGIVSNPFGLVDLKSWILSTMQIRKVNPLPPFLPIVAHDGGYLYFPNGSRVSYQEEEQISLTAVISWPMKTIIASTPEYFRLEVYDLEKDFAEARNLAETSEINARNAYEKLPLIGPHRDLRLVEEASDAPGDPRGILEKPSGDLIASGPIEVEGWALLPGKIVDVVTGIGMNWTTVQYPIERPDVELAFPSVPKARFSGFHAMLKLPEFSLAEGQSPLTVVFRYLDVDGRVKSWSCQRSVVIRCPSQESPPIKPS